MAESSIIEHLFHYSNPTLWESIVRIILSLLLGGAIGLERERKHRAAGLRTFTLICLGSTIAMLLSIWTPWMLGASSNNPGDPGRIAAQVLTGVGFLGAGAIIHTKGSIQGLTTAAGIWVSAVIGLTVGAGLYIPAIFCTVVVVAVLNSFERIELDHHVGGYNKLMEIQFGTANTENIPIKEILKKHSVSIITMSSEYNLKEDSSTITMQVRMSSRTSESGLTKEIKELPQITGFKFYS